jgi:subtilase family serine protease
VEVILTDDSDLTNNLASSYPLSVLPDLLIAKADYTVSETELLEGEEITLATTIHNIGRATASYALVKFYTPDEFIGYDIVNVSIGGAASASTTWTPPLGVHLVYVEVDPADHIDEKVESNNIQEITVTVYRTMDLTVDMQVEEKGKDKVNITANIPNNGDHEASNIKVEFYDGTPGLGGVLINSTTIDKIAGHGSSSFSFEWQTTSGRKNIYAVVDGMDLVPETDETNNVQAKSVQVGGDKEDEGSPILLIVLIIVLIAVPVVLILFWWRKKLFH